MPCADRCWVHSGLSQWFANIVNIEQVKRSRHMLTLEMSWQSSARYIGALPDEQWKNWTRCHTGTNSCLIQGADNDPSIIVVADLGVASLPHKCQPALPSSRQHPSYCDCLEVKSEYYQNCSVLGCVTVFTVSSTLMWAVLTDWVCHIGTLTP